MMGQKAVELKLYLSFSLDAAVPGKHIVRRLAGAVDFAFVRSLVSKYYSNTGQPSVDPVVLFKLWLLGYLFNIRSERRLCEEASLNLAWRWFLGYELDEPLPDHSVLTKARRRFGTRVYELFFRRIVQLCEERGLVQGDVLFIDSTLSDANAARDTLRSRALAGPRLPEPAQFVKDLFALNEPAPEPEPPREKGGTGPKPGPLAVQPTLRSSLVSTTDPDAEVATRHNGRSRLVYKTQVVVDDGKANVITAVDVGAAGDSDASSVGKMLDKHELNLRRAPRELVGDSGYGTEGGLRECEARGIVATLNQKRKGNNTGLFSLDDFTFVAERDVYICPAGTELVRAAEHFTMHKSVYRPKGKYTCANCALKAQCTPGRVNRQIQRSWAAEVTERARAHIATRHAQRRLRRRQIVSERIMADLKFKHGFERAQFRGRASVQIQALLTAAVINLKQLLKRSPEAQSGSVLPVGDAPTQRLHGVFLTLRALSRHSRRLTEFRSSSRGGVQIRRLTRPFGNRPFVSGITGWSMRVVGSWSKPKANW
jgi:transposase